MSYARLLALVMLMPVHGLLIFNQHWSQVQWGQMFSGIVLMMESQTTSRESISDCLQPLKSSLTALACALRPSFSCFLKLTSKNMITKS